MAKPKKKIFTVMATVILNVTVDTPADTLEEAFKIARTYSIEDFLIKPGDTTDREARITGIYE